MLEKLNLYLSRYQVLYFCLYLVSKYADPIALAFTFVGGMFLTTAPYSCL